MTERTASDAEHAKAAGETIKALCDRLRQVWGGEVRGKKPRVPIEVLAADFEAGLSPTRIAHKHGMSRECVRSRLNNWNPGCVARRQRHQQYEYLLSKFSESNRKRKEREERNRRIFEEALAGNSFREIARRHGMSGAGVARLAVRMGIPQRRTCSRQRDAEWLAMYEKGMSIKQIAQRVGRPWSTVREGVARARDGYVFRERMINR